MQIIRAMDTPARRPLAPLRLRVAAVLSSLTPNGVGI
jgi:hypothetical protein